jgi:UDP-N-acetylglucosamine 2-epimerase (non-hydrolysing)
MREVTERIEGIEAGTALLVGTDEQKILLEARKLLTSKEAYSQMSNATNPYGDGTTSAAIAELTWNNL